MRAMVIFLFLFFFQSGWASSIAQSNLYWDMQQATPTGVISLLQVSSLVQGNNYGATTFFTSLSPSQQYAGASGGHNAGVAARPGARTTGTSGSAYFGLTLTPAAGYRIRILSVAFGSRSTSTGPARWGLFSSVDQFIAPAYSSVLSANSVWAWQSSAALTLMSSQPLELRIYGYEGVGTTAINVTNWRIDDLIIHYQVEPISLPVKWLYFRHQINTNGLSLFWGTASEHRNKCFLVQRSYNGYEYQTLGTIYPDTRQLAPDATRDYSFLDTTHNQGIVFYRIKQIDQDGSYSFSTIIKVSLGSDQSLFAFRLLYVDLLSGRLELLVERGASWRKLELYNLRGQCVSAQLIPEEISRSAHVASVKIDIAGLLPGVYYLVAVSSWNRTKGKALLIR